jgi:Dyp-type peroxidase family
MTDETFAAEQIQSHFVRAGLQGSKRRDWSLFAFFRVLSEPEATESLDRMLGNDGNAPTIEESVRFDKIALELVNPTLWTPFVDSVEEAASRAQPARHFLNWLRTVAGGGHEPLINHLGAMAQRLETSNLSAEKFAWASSGFMQPDVKMVPQLLGNIEYLRDDGDGRGLEVLRKGLEGVCAYELIRQINRALQGVPVVRSAAHEAMGDGQGDRSPVEVAFTYPGLAALGLSAKVLSSFPDVFKDGMAARASRLGDVGESAPSKWTGELGQSAIHGLLAGGFAVEGADEQDWEELRRQIRVFNEAGPGEGVALRFKLAAIFRAIGIEILHIELGQDPYYAAKDGTITRPTHRHEHFGFRDGISQPHFDIPGSGTPTGNGSWRPLAPGEIYLGARDEDGCVQAAPDHKALRDGGTYLVFRKLRQDVAGFRAFLGAARPGPKDKQDRLAAQFVGRWRNGASIVRAPGAQPDIGPQDEQDLNNFRYVEEDPLGRNCPLGAHVRRTNPRDIGGQTQAKRHRIVRRGMAYGGPFLPEESAGDDKERGMLFIALNARIDVQFELIQSRWINGGEFLRQAGLGKCPITGSNAGLPSDQFLATDSATPVNCIPAFVHMRGGDYFYAPGIEGLLAIANEQIKAPDLGLPTDNGHNNVPSEDVFSPAKIAELVRYTLGVGPKQVPFKPVSDPKDYAEDETISKPMVFVGQHAQVKAVLSGALDGVGVRHYIDASERMMNGARLLISTETGDQELRAPMRAMLEKAWEVLKPYKAFGDALDEGISQAIARTKTVGKIDLVHDLAVDPVYQLVSKVYGVPGPNWLTELAVALPFGRQHISELHPDWLATLRGKTPPNQALTTLQVWSILMFSDLIGNPRMQDELRVFAMEAASEFTVYLERLLDKERKKPKKKAGECQTLVEAFRAIEGETFAGTTLTSAQHYRIARLLLTELVPSALAVIPATFGSLMAPLLNNRVNLSYLIEILDKVDPDEGLKRLIYETNRLSPSLPLLQRYAVKDVPLSETVKIEAGNWIGALVIAANLDPRVFPKSEKFSLGPKFGGVKRDIKDYIMFGGDGSDRACWGRDKLAMMALSKFVRAASRLPGLRRVAGAGGAPVQIIRTMIGFPARFARH